ncbi:Esterase/lipase superfamily enzyme [Neorhodopirellula lusitana]|uniref:Esterase/lipase superfamily enzyme n=1 Tax=Neorhodopirellula lusitana TaxID=445327 RepID=A0ABY1PU40_9BACT|nr:alpha/beta hydrolase [Neorhodopirellula lusitana]SMP43995.1 Esterase/lipase superfamily enzyme [Neorhodopirellula lusitana]
MDFRYALAVQVTGASTLVLMGALVGGCSKSSDASMEESAPAELEVVVDEIQLPESIQYDSPEYSIRDYGTPYAAEAISRAQTSAGVQTGHGVPSEVAGGEQPAPGGSFEAASSAAMAVPGNQNSRIEPSGTMGPAANRPTFGAVVEKTPSRNRFSPSRNDSSQSNTAWMPPAGATQSPSAGFSTGMDRPKSSGSSATPSASMAMPAPAPAPTPVAAAEVPGVEPVADDSAFQTVNVFYATDREQASLSLADFHLSGQRRWISGLGVGGGVAAIFLLISCLLRNRAAAMLTGGLMAAMSVAAIATFVSGSASIEKIGVTYSAERGELVRGICQVTVPKNHTRGSVERPSLLKFEVNEDQAKHIVLTSVEPLPSDEFHQQLKTELASTSEPDLLVFIHGYNVDFESAVHRTAQISVDLPFQGVPVCYSWPSQGTLLGYPIDENNAAWTVGHLKEFLGELVEQSGAKSIHVVAHSMGNRAMTSALQQLALTHPHDGPLFDRVVLAAPDVDADLFRKDLAPALTQVARHVTLYASSSDQALIASKQVHGYPRAGETGDHLVVVNGVDTIDVSGIDLSLLGHSYYGDSEPMLRDLFEVLLSRLPASQRDTLVSRDFQSQVYWQLANQARIATGVAR